MAEQQFKTQGERLCAAAENSMVMTGARRSFLSRYGANSTLMPFRQNGVFAVADIVDPNTHWVTFVPPRQERMWGQGERPPSETTKVALGGLQALQNYVFLVQEGVLPEPGRLVGKVLKESMDADSLDVAARQLGFRQCNALEELDGFEGEKAIKPPEGPVIVDFDDFAKRVLGPEAQALEIGLLRMLGERATHKGDIVSPKLVHAKV